MPRRAVVYIAAVIAAGFGALAFTATLVRAEHLEHLPVTVILAVGVLVGECTSIRVRRNGATGEITPSTTFLYAMVIVAGPAGVLIDVAACVAADVFRRKEPVKVVFNAAQYGLSLSVAAVLLQEFAGVPMRGATHFEPGDLGWIVLGALAFFVINSMIVAAVIALLEHDSVWGYFSQDFVFDASSAGLLLGISPIVVLAGDFTVLILPLLGLPLLAIVQNQRQALVNEHQAFHDALSGLPNRVLFRERVEYAVRAAARERDAGAVMLMDLDHFKEINDTLGHHNGDLLLREVAARLEGLVDEPATVARLGGDEFGVLLPVTTGDDEAATLAERIAAELRRPLEIGGMELVVGASIGVAVYPEHGGDVEALLQRADIAMYWAKRRRLGHAVYGPEQDFYSPARLELAGELRRAVEQGELIAHYQPKVELATGRLHGLEALMRWDHPTRGALPPGEFIPIAEQSGLITQATMAMIENVLRQTRRWAELGLDVPVSVNLSVRSLLDRRLPRLIGELLERTGAPAEVLELEITESTIMADAERAEQILAELSAMGCAVSIDDFGTGYSSLAYLRRLPVDTLKIDKSFVIGLAENSNDVVIVRSTIELAHNLGLKVVAEGIEDQDTWDELERLGCDVGQGFGISRPLPTADAERWMIEWRASHERSSGEPAVAAA